MSKTLLLTLFGLAATLPAFGDVVYTSSAAFTAAVAGLSNVVTETYSSGFTDGQDISSGSTFDGITYSNFTGGYTDADITSKYNAFSGLSLGADNTAYFSNTTQTFFIGSSSCSPTAPLAPCNEGITLTFSGPVDAVGVFYNVTQNSGSYGFTTNTGSTASTGSATYDTPTSFVFAGLVSNTPFSSVTLFGAGSYNVPEIEAFTPTPEPSNYLALGIGLAAFAFVRRFQRSKAKIFVI